VVKPRPPQATQNRPDYPARVLGVFATLLSVFSFWVNYASSLPAITTTVELVEPLAPGKQIHFRVLLENTGTTTARQLHPTLAFKFARADIPFEPTYRPVEITGPNEGEKTSDLGPSSHTTLVSTNPLSLAHDHDVNAVLSGDWNLFLYGKSTYKDILHISHEFHFCRYFRPVPGAEPLKLSYYTWYNDAD
jgi:hypothetical protein